MDPKDAIREEILRVAKTSLSEWFVTITLPLKKTRTDWQQSCHLSYRVIIELFEEENIRFSLFLPNSIHLTQPLDDAFGPLTKA